MSSLYNGIAANATRPGAINIQSSTNATPIQIQSVSAHNLTTGDRVAISGHNVNTSANGIWAITKVDNTHFTLQTWSGANSVGVGVGGNTGSFQSLGFAPDTYTIPSDGDPMSAASVNVALEALGDRVATTSSMVLGAARLIGVYQGQNLAHDYTDHLLGGGVTLAASATWQKLATVISANRTPGLNGDLLMVSFTGFMTCGTTTNNAIGLSIYDEAGTFDPTFIPAVVQSSFSTMTAGTPITITGAVFLVSDMPNGINMDLAAFGSGGADGPFHVFGAYMGTIYHYRHNVAGNANNDQ